MTNAEQPVLHRIRRVKCGEEKPACLRCTSTGRTCDGYDAQTSAAKKRVAVQQRPVQGSVARTSGSLRTLRPLAASIDGTDKERMYFNTYRRIVEEGMAHHVANAAAFWRITIPQMALVESPIKHAYVALGAALQSFQMREKEQRDRGETSILTPTELFGLDHYGRALSLLQKPADPEMADRIDVVILCCIAFVYIEILRDNVDAALTHLSNGLRIIDTLPDETLAPLADQKDRIVSDRYPTSRPPNPRILGMLAQISVLELSACVFARDFKPVISLRLLEMRKTDDFPVPEFCNVTEVHQDMSQFIRDTFALLYISRPFKDDASFWATGTWGLQRSIVFSRMKQIRERIKQFTTSRYMPEPGTYPYRSLLLDLIHFQVVEACFFSLFPAADVMHGQLAEFTKLLNTPVHADLIRRGLLPSAASSDGIPIDPALLLDDSEAFPLPGIQRTPAFTRRMEEVVIIAEAAKRELHNTSSAMQRDRWLMLDVGLSPPMHFVVDHCRDPALRQRAINVMRSNNSRRENLWDGDRVSRLRSAATRAGVEVPRSMFDSMAVEALYEQLDGLDISDD